MADELLVTPNAGAAPAPEPAAEPAPETPETGTPGKLPDDLIHIPAMQALIAGSPPAISANLKEFASNPVAKLVAENKPALLQAGIGFYRSLSGDLGVLFNMFHLHPQDLQAADKAGKLGMIAPPFDVVNHTVSKSGITNPVLSVKDTPKGFKSPTLRSPPQMAGSTPPGAPQTAPVTNSPGISPATAGIQHQIMAQRAKNVTPGAPTSGPAPGAGRLLNQILTPAV